MLVLREDRTGGGTEREDEEVEEDACELAGDAEVAERGDAKHPADEQRQALAFDLASDVGPRDLESEREGRPACSAGDASSRAPRRRPPEQEKADKAGSQLLGDQGEDTRARESEGDCHDRRDEVADEEASGERLEPQRTAQQDCLHARQGGHQQAQGQQSEHECEFRQVQERSRQRRRGEHTAGDEHSQAHADPEDRVEQLVSQLIDDADVGRGAEVDEHGEEAGEGEGEGDDPEVGGVQRSG